MAKKRKPVDDPLPVLAIEANDKKAVKDVFDLALMPVEYLDDPSSDSELRQDAEEYAYGTTFNVVSASGLSFTAEIKFKGVNVGTTDFEVDLNNLPHVTVNVANKHPVSSRKAEFEGVLQRCGRKGWLQLWFDSGHTVSDGTLYLVRHQDLPFCGFRWADFSKYDITREKPDDLTEIGMHDSLFCWTKKTWPKVNPTALPVGGWLACDDGAGEMADFVHFDDRDSADVPLLTLIHAKGAHSKAATREMSVSAYEVVCSQAVKNLRFLSNRIASEGLKGGIGKKIGTAVWNNGKASDRTKFLKKLDGVGSNYRRQVVLLQPHVSKAMIDAVSLKPKSSNGGRWRQLCSLLHATKAACSSYGADFVVVGPLT